MRCRFINFSSAQRSLKLTLLLLSFFALIYPLHTAEDSTPNDRQGIDASAVKPNSVRGFKHGALDGDYAILRGKFTSQKEPFLFSFTDDGRHFIDVKFAPGSLPADFMFNANYFLWGRMEKSFGSDPVIRAESLSPRLQNLRYQIRVIP